MTSSGKLIFTQRFIRTAAAGTMVLLSTTLLFAAGSREQVQLQIERVALFKNGLGYFTSETVLPKKATTVEFGQLPVPSLGTFWVGYPETVQVRSLITSMEETEEVVPIRAVFQLLQANIGSKVELMTSQKDAAVIKGTVAGVISDQVPVEPPSPYVMDVRRDQRNRRYYTYGNTPVALIKTDTCLVAVNASSIIRADFEGDDVKTEVTMKSKRPSLRMELERPADGRPVSVSFLARGITWSPSYLIDLSDPETARLSAKALVVNEVADLDGVALELVTGFPNIQFAEVTSPMAMSQDLAGFLKALTSGRSESQRGRGYMMQQQAMVANTAMYDERTSAPLPSYSTAKGGTVSEDLFLYPVKDFHLRRGETATIPLFTAELPYKHIYTWKIDDILDKDERYRRNHNEKEKAEEVWHSCRITNNMKMPWTTAAAQFVKNRQFTGQDICYYTAPGSETTIRINRAMNVIAEEAEVELERKRNAATFYGSRYDLVKVKGELKIRSRLDKTVNVEITKQLSGTVLSTSPEAKDTPTAKGLKRVNPRHVLQWEMELGPGKKKALTYTYELYIRN